MKISTLLDQIEFGQIVLPEFQRGYVWNRDQVRGLVRSLYKRYPAGSLLTWITDEQAPDKALLAAEGWRLFSLEEVIGVPQLLEVALGTSGITDRGIA